MKISEAQIEKVVELFEEEGFDLVQLIEKLDAQQSLLLAYCLSENFSLLTEEEKKYFQYLALVIIKTTTANIEEIEEYNQDDIDLAEELNWKLMETNSSKEFNTRLNIFFENCKEEDLLAFIEDSLAPEADDFISPIGRELMFIGLKTIVDVLAD